jgi:alpha-glucosidase
MSPTAPSRHWWQDAVVYQVYVRSFADSSGDGIGDLDGIRSRLDDLASLGVDALWLNPCYPSPQHDHGYDVADYFGIHSEYGTLDTFDRLLADARARGIRIVMDLVPNHCSSDHEWFVAARTASPGSPERARFWIRDGKPDGAGDPNGAPPNNWRAGFGGGAWTRLSPDDSQWYLGTFTPQQPDLNHTNADVQAMFVDVLEFWFDRGVEGFRVDAIQPVGKHPDLPDQPPVPAGTPELQITWENEYTIFRPEGHDVWRYLRGALDDYMERHPGRDLMLVAEAYLVGRPELLAEFVRPDEFHQVFTFDLMLARWNVESIGRALGDLLWLNERGIDPCLTLNNHDIQRAVTRLGRADAHVPHATVANALLKSDASVDIEVGRRRARALISLAMMLPGSIYLYQGDELGLPEVLDLPDDRRQDPVFIRTGGAELGRDGCRVPLPWTNDPETSFGFSTRSGDEAPAPPWLPQPDDWGRFARSTQDDIAGSDLDLYRTLIDARRKHAQTQPIATECLDLGPGLVAVRRDRLVAVLNMTVDPLTLDMGHEALASAQPVVASEPAEMHTPGVIPPDSTIWFVS